MSFNFVDYLSLHNVGWYALGFGRQVYFLERYFELIMKYSFCHFFNLTPLT